MLLKNRKVNFALLGVCSLLGSGCTPRLGGSDYGISAVGEFSETYIGTIASKSVVRIAGRDTGQDNTPGLGAGLGAVGGALAGSQIGYGKGQIAGAVVGGLAAGVAGHYIEKSLTDQDGFSYTVNLDNGRMVTIVQGAEPNLSVGQRVKVVKSENRRGGRSRVLPL